MILLHKIVCYFVLKKVEGEERETLEGLCKHALIALSYAFMDCTCIGVEGFIKDGR